MLKIYCIKQMSASIIVYPEGNPARIEFKGGVARNNYRGQYATMDETMQRAIESSNLFGDCVNGMIYLSEKFGEKEVPKAVEKRPEPVKEEKKEEVSKEPVVMKYAEAKKFLAEKGVSPDNLKNFPQVKKEAKAFGIEVQ